MSEWMNHTRWMNDRTTDIEWREDEKTGEGLKTGDWSFKLQRLSRSSNSVHVREQIFLLSLPASSFLFRSRMWCLSLPNVNLVCVRVYVLCVHPASIHPPNQTMSQRANSQERERRVFDPRPAHRRLPLSLVVKSFWCRCTSGLKFVLWLRETLQKFRTAGEEKRKLTERDRKRSVFESPQRMLLFVVSHSSCYAHTRPPVRFFLFYNAFTMHSRCIYNACMYLFFPLFPRNDHLLGSYVLTTNRWWFMSMTTIF